MHIYLIIHTNQNQIIMVKKRFQKPTMKIVSLPNSSKLLAGSSELNATRNDYTEGGIMEWE